MSLHSFFKAFDTVNRDILLAKLPVFVFNWILSFLSVRSELCKASGELFSVRYIIRSIIQGSGIGPTLYVLMESDVCQRSSNNILFKYADDTNLLVP